MTCRIRKVTFCHLTSMGGEKRDGRVTVRAMSVTAIDDFVA
jgi:hypothetical protein